MRALIYLGANVYGSWLIWQGAHPLVAAVKISALAVVVGLAMTHALKLFHVEPYS